jgi:prepilin-type N-terminal cleavage/methylation domain-containing protein
MIFLRRGFTLIELLVTVAIIGVVTSIVLVSFAGNRVKKDTESAAVVIAGKVKEAQAAVLTGRQHIPGTVPCAYRVTWSGSTLTSSYIYKSGNSCTQVASISTYTITIGATFTTSGSLDFSIPHARTATNQIITVQKGSSTHSVCIKSDGLIDTKLSATSC